MAWRGYTLMLLSLMVAGCQSQRPEQPIIKPTLENFSNGYDVKFEWDQGFTKVSVIELGTNFEIEGDLKAMILKAAAVKIADTLKPLGCTRAHGTLPCWIEKKGGRPQPNCNLMSDWELRDPDSETPLMAGSQSGNLSAVKEKLDHGADANTSDQSGTTALMYAALNNHSPIVQLLLQRGADPDRKSRYGSSALYYGATSDPDIVESLLKGHAEVDVRNEDSETPLFSAAKTLNPDRRLQILDMRLLITAGANVNAATVSGLTPLMTATIQGSAPAVKLLLANGADPHLRRNDGQTALDFALNSREPQPEIIRLLKHASNNH